MKLLSFTSTIDAQIETICIEFSEEHTYLPTYNPILFCLKIRIEILVIQFCKCEVNFGKLNACSFFTISWFFFKKKLRYISTKQRIVCTFFFAALYEFCENYKYTTAILLHEFALKYYHTWVYVVIKLSRSLLLCKFLKKFCDIMKQPL